MDFHGYIEALYDKEGKEKTIDMNGLWNTILSTPRKIIEANEPVLPLITHYMEAHPDAKNTICEAITKRIETLKSTAGLGERMEAILPVLLFLNCLPEAQADEIIEPLIDLMQQYVIENPEIVLPDDIIHCFEEVDDIDNKVLLKWLDVCKKNLETKKQGAMIFLGFLQMSFMDEEGEEEEQGGLSQYCETIMKEALADEQPANKVIGCFLMEVGFFSWLDKQNELLDLLLPMLISQDNLVAKRSHGVLKGLISDGFLCDSKCLKRVIGQFEQYKREHWYMFIKLLSRFLFPDDEDDEDEEEEAVNLEIIQPIIDWVGGHLEAGDPLLQALCLDLIGDVSAKSAMAAEDFVSNGMAISKTLINEEKWECYEYVANFLIAMSEQFADQVSKDLPPLCDKLVDSLENEATGNLKHRIYTAAALAGMAGKGHATDITSKLQSFVSSHWDDENEDTIVKLCTILIPMKDSYNDDFANEVFVRLMRRVQDTEDIECAGTWIHVMKKLLKRYAIKEDILEAFIQNILSGRLKSLWGGQPHRCIPPCVPLFDFLAGFIRRYPSKSQNICDQVCEWVKLTPYGTVPLLMKCLKTGVSVGVIKAPQTAALRQVLFDLCKALESDEGEDVKYVFETMLELFLHFPDEMGPASELVALVRPWVEKAKQQSQCSCEEESCGCGCDDGAVEAMPAATALVFSIYASAHSPEVVDEEVLTGIVGFLPYGPDVQEMSGIMEQMCSLLESPEKYECVLLPCLQVITDMLLMKKSEFEGYSFESDLVKEMKDVLKACLHTKPTLKARIQATLKSSRAKLNRFNTLLKGA